MNRTRLKATFKIYRDMPSWASGDNYISLGTCLLASTHCTLACLVPQILVMQETSATARSSCKKLKRKVGGNKSGLVAFMVPQILVMQETSATARSSCKRLNLLLSCEYQQGDQTNRYFESITQGLLRRRCVPGGPTRQSAMCGEGLLCSCGLRDKVFLIPEQYGEGRLRRRMQPPLFSDWQKPLNRNKH